jgi:hypothetical protein
MKNIYNLLTDAFVRIGKNESDYYVIVQDNYKITITSRLSPEIYYAALTLIMRADGTLYDFRDENTLFTNDDWNAFCQIIEREIPSSFITAGELLQISPLLYPVHNDMIYEDSAVQDNDNIEIGDDILANYRNLTVDTNVARFVDIDEFNDEEQAQNIHELS